MHVKHATLLKCCIPVSISDAELSYGVDSALDWPPAQMRMAEQAEEQRRAAEQAAVSARAAEQARKAALAEERRLKLEAEVQVGYCRTPDRHTVSCRKSTDILPRPLDGQCVVQWAAHNVVQSCYCVLAEANAIRPSMWL